MLDNGLVTAESALDAIVKIVISDQFINTPENAVMVIEVITENLELKQQLFVEMDKVFPPDVPLLSTTSELRIMDTAQDPLHLERTLTAHFWFLAHLVPRV